MKESKFFRYNDKSSKSYLVFKQQFRQKANTISKAPLYSSRIDFECLAKWLKMILVTTSWTKRLKPETQSARNYRTLQKNSPKTHMPASRKAIKKNLLFSTVRRPTSAKCLQKLKQHWGENWCLLFLENQHSRTEIDIFTPCRWAWVNLEPGNSKTTLRIMDGPRIYFNTSMKPTWHAWWRNRKKNHHKSSIEKIRTLKKWKTFSSKTGQTMRN